MMLLITYYNLKITEITLVLMDLSHPTPSLVKVAVLHRSAVQYNFKHFERENLENNGTVFHAYSKIIMELIFFYVKNMLQEGIQYFDILY